MSETLSVSLDTSKETVQPTLEEQAAALDKQLATPAAPADPNRPAWLNEKFKSPEDLAKAYEELEKKLGSKTKDEPTEDNEETNDGEEQDEDAPAADRAAAQKAADDAAKKAGLDLTELSKSYWETGSLSEDQFKSLEKAGYPRDLVNQFIAGQEAVLNQRAQAVYQSVGGQEEYNAMIQWAGENLSPKEIAAFNRTVNGDDTDAISLAVRGLKAQYAGQVGFEPSTTVRGQTAPKTAPVAYRSLAEMQKDMSDPRYQNDPAFRKEVEQKLARSDIM
jgi:hypothetical protein